MLVTQETIDFVRTRFERAWYDAVLHADEMLPVWRRLLTRYDESSRQYHNLAHIAYCLQKLEEIPGLREEVGGVWTAAVFAVIYHDAVYDVFAPRGKNEDDSAAIAFRDICDAGSPRLAHVVADYVLETKHDAERVPKSAGARAVVDVDLINFSDRLEVFLAHSNAIREEYRKAYPDDAFFKVRRVKVLESFLKRECIYHTDACSMFEAGARANLLYVITTGAKC